MRTKGCILLFIIFIAIRCVFRRIPPNSVETSFVLLLQLSIGALHSAIQRGTSIDQHCMLDSGPKLNQEFSLVLHLVCVQYYGKHPHIVESIGDQRVHHFPMCFGHRSAYTISRNTPTEKTNSPYIISDLFFIHLKI